MRYELRIKAFTTAALTFLICAWTGRHFLVEYIAFRCGVQWLAPTTPLQDIILFRIAFGAFGPLAAILSVFPLGRPALRAFNAALGLLCLTLALVSGGWQPSKTAYLNGLSSAVSKPEIRAALSKLQIEARAFTGATEKEISDIPQPLRDLGKPFRGAIIFPSGELRLLWGGRDIGGWGISISKTKPIGVNLHSQQVYDDVYVTFLSPF